MLRSLAGAAAAGVLLAPLSAASTTGSSFAYLQLAAEPVGRSLGGAHLATVTGPAATAWNPAGLGAEARPALLVAHTSWMAGTSWQWGGASLPLGGGGLGLGCGVVRSGALAGYDIEGRPTGSFTPFQGYAALGYGRPVAPRLRAGLSAELLLERDGRDREYHAWAGGAGLQFESGRLHLAATALHLGPALRAGGEAYPLPATLALAVSFDLRRRCRLHLAAVRIGADPATVRCGVEWGATAALRAYAGARSLPDAGLGRLQATLGMAIDLGRAQVGYGYQPARDLDASHQFSLTLNFGG